MWPLNHMLFIKKHVAPMENTFECIVCNERIFLHVGEKERHIRTAKYPCRQNHID